MRIDASSCVNHSRSKFEQKNLQALNLPPAPGRKKRSTSHFYWGNIYFEQEKISVSQQLSCKQIQIEKSLLKGSTFSCLSLNGNNKKFKKKKNQSRIKTSNKNFKCKEFPWARLWKCFRKDNTQPNWQPPLLLFIVHVCNASEWL